MAEYSGGGFASPRIEPSRCRCYTFRVRALGGYTLTVPSPVSTWPKPLHYVLRSSKDKLGYKGFDLSWDQEKRGFALSGTVETSVRLSQKKKFSFWIVKPFALPNFSVPLVSDCFANTLVFSWYLCLWFCVHELQYNVDLSVWMSVRESSCLSVRLNVCTQVMVSVCLSCANTWILNHLRLTRCTCAATRFQCVQSRSCESILHF